MAEEQRLRRKCNRYAKRLVLLGEDDVVWEAEPTPQNTSSNSDYANCPHWKVYNKGGSGEFGVCDCQGRLK